MSSKNAARVDRVEENHEYRTNITRMAIKSAMKRAISKEFEADRAMI